MMEGKGLTGSIHTAAVLWTGGKDSAMALYEAGNCGFHISCLVTFAPVKPDFRAHPLAVMTMQAEVLGLPHYVLPVSEPYDKSYECGLRRLREEHGIDCVVTGDIAEVNGYPNWIRERSRPVGMEVYTPLWGRDRDTLMAQLLGRSFRVCISCVDTRWLDQSWVGRELDEAAVEELHAIRRINGLDLCGENGEYHTMVIGGPQFAQCIDIRSYSKCMTDLLVYTEIQVSKLVYR